MFAPIGVQFDTVLVLNIDPCRMRIGWSNSNILRVSGKIIKGRDRSTYRTETMTLSSLPWSRAAAFSQASSISPEISPGSTVWKSTRTDSGSTLLTSISLVAGINIGLLHGDTGVRGRLALPSLFVGVPGTGASVADGLGLRFLRDSTERGALYFLFAVRSGVAGALTEDFEMESKEDTEDIEETEGARLGVNSGVRIDFELAGVLGILLVVLMM